MRGDHLAAGTFGVFQATLSLVQCRHAVILIIIVIGLSPDRLCLCSLGLRRNVVRALLDIRSRPRR